MIVTLTPNPSLDLLFSAERLLWDDANRLPPPRRRAGGQGINLVRAVRALEPGAAAMAVAPLGGPVGRELEELLDGEGTPIRAVPLDGETRVFVGVRESGSGRALLLNPTGPEAGPEDGRALLDAVEDVLADHEAKGGWLVCCGSLLPGLPPDFYARAGDMARLRGFRFVPDCDGPALAAAIHAGCDLLVPNEHEAGRLLGRELAGAEAEVMATAARELCSLGPDAAVVTLGERGAVGCFPTGSWWARPELPESLAAEAAAGSAVGAGDAFLAALLLHIDTLDPPAALARAVAAGTAALLSRGPDLVRAEDVTRVLPHVSVRRDVGR
jgi:1-phosphofructokinase family hexose kinase